MLDSTVVSLYDVHVRTEQRNNETTKGDSSMTMHTLESFQFDTNRTFGIEIEFFGVHVTKVVEALKANEINFKQESYSHEARPHWKLIYDVSVTNRGTGLPRGGHELVSPILVGREGLEEVRKVMAVLDSIGAKVDKTCGLHVHHGVRDFQVRDFQNIYSLYYKFENFFDAVVAPSRRQSVNQYCRGLNQGLIEQVQKATTLDELKRILADRYLKLNFQAFIRHNTIEFRQHSGTVNGEKAVNWIVFTQAVVERAKLETIRIAKKDHDRDAVTNFNHERRLRRTLFGEVTRESLENEYGQAVKFQIKRRQQFEAQAA